METTSLPGYSFATKEYCLLTKPGIIMGNIITTAGGFALASRTHFDWLLFVATMTGLSFIIGSACVFNNYIDRRHDRKMSRTKQRGLASGSVSTVGALTFGVLLGITGVFTLAIRTNPLTLSVALVGFFVYVILYSFSKYYSMHGTLIGSIAGAIPPVVGYTAVTRQLDLASWLLFTMVVLWQMPHFFAIAISRLEDYKEAGIPVLPLKKGIQTTKFQMLFYIFTFTLTAALLTLFGYTGVLFLGLTTLLGIGWFCLGVLGLNSNDDTLWAKQMFVFSLVVILTLCLAIPFST
jgi:heme o synthase